MPQRSNTRKGKRRIQKGGSVPFLDADRLGYPTPDSIRANMDLINIGCHGHISDLADFFVVPPNTYLMFTARSGEPASGDTPSEIPYISYKNSEDTYYSRFYRHIFRPYGERSNSPTQQLYDETLYIYEPGDIIPDYVLSFKNTPTFMFLHGIYRLPIASLSGPDKVGSSFLGLTLGYIKELVEKGVLKEEDLQELSADDRKMMEDTTTEKLKEYFGAVRTPGFRRTTLFNKLETICCRENPENLLYQPPFSPEDLQANNYYIRLSTIFYTLPKDPRKRDRFFFLNFCRVSYKNVFIEFDESNPTSQIPTLLRTMSFSAKCGFSDIEEAFNVVRVYMRFCEYPLALKKKLVGHPVVRGMIALLKRGFEPTAFGVPSWTTCLEGTYDTLSRQEQLEMTADFVGYFTIDDIAELAQLARYFQVAIQAEEGGPEKQALIELARPFQSVYAQIGKELAQTTKTQQTARELISEIYKVLHSKLQGVLRHTREDYLDLRSTPFKRLEKFLGELQKGEYDDMLIKYVGDSANTMNSSEIQELLYSLFEDYTGSAGRIDSGLPFPSIRVPNTSIPIKNGATINVPFQFRSLRNRPAYVNTLAPAAEPTAEPAEPAPLAYVETEKERKKREKREKKFAAFAAAMAEAVAAPNATGSARKTRRRTRRV